METTIDRIGAPQARPAAPSPGLDGIARASTPDVLHWLAGEVDLAPVMSVDPVVDGRRCVGCLVGVRARRLA